MYFVVYDSNDNIIAYCDDFDELSKFVERRKRQLKYDLLRRRFVQVQQGLGSSYYIYRFNK